MNRELYPSSHDQGSSCSASEDGHCVTCSDEALAATVLDVDLALGMAFVAVQGQTIEVDISLLDEVTPDDQVLIHGGVAIAKL